MKTLALAWASALDSCSRAAAATSAADVTSAPSPLLPQGQIYDLATAGGMLFSAGQDASIRVWSFNPQGNLFVFAVSACVWCTSYKCCLLAAEACRHLAVLPMIPPDPS
jgi:hypothetical protein